MLFGDRIRRLTKWIHLYHRRANKDRRFRGFEQAIDRKLLLVGRWASVQWSTGGYDFGRQHSRNWTNNLFLQTFLHTMALSFFSRSPSVIYCIIYRHCKSSFSSFLNSFSKRPRKKKLLQFFLAIFNEEGRFRKKILTKFYGILNPIFQNLERNSANLCIGELCKNDIKYVQVDLVGLVKSFLTSI